jgi:hypothetical protein
VDNVRLVFAYSSSMAQVDRRRVYIYFQCRNGWHCQFLEGDLKTALPRKLHFKSEDKVIELVERGGGLTDQESRLMLNQAIVTGRGGVFLNLAAEQYAKLN